METVSHHGRETAYRFVGDDGSRGDDPSGADKSEGEVDSGSVDSGDDDSGSVDDSGAILYVHGSGATHRLWASQYAPDGPARPAVALDLSGHGDSEDVDTEPGPETLRSYARDVVAVARATEANVLVGNSLGGAVALHVSLETAFEPSGLVLAGTGAKLAVLDHLREWLESDFDRAVEFLHGPDRLFHDVAEQDRERSETAMRATGRRVTRRDFLTCHEFDVRDRLDEVDAPALALVGEHDSLTPPAYHEYLAAEIPDCAYAEIENAAHLAMVERPSAFNERAGAFLDANGLRGGPE